MGSVDFESALSHCLRAEQEQNRRLRERVSELEFEAEEARKAKCKYWDVCRSTCTIEKKSVS
ncbi:MAG: hypothetical protein WDA26_13360 [Pusillimonas sp.]